MASVTNKLIEKDLIKPPRFLKDSVHYETYMGSHAYGVNKKDSDFDVYGFCIPPKNVIFPHLDGFISGFDKGNNRFDQFQAHHVQWVDKKKEYDITIYNIVRYFRLCADGNPNMIDSLFTPPTCVVSMSRLGNMVKENRKLFLSKKCFHTFKGYAYAQMSKIRGGTNKSNPNRAESIEKYGYDVKFAYHLVRLLNECEQILTEGDLDLLRCREQLKSIRRGEWSLAEVEEYFNHKEKILEKLGAESDAVPHLVREDEIKQLLMNVLEEHYESLDGCVAQPNKDAMTLQKIRELVN